MTRARGSQIAGLAWTHASAFGGAVADRMSGSERRVRTDSVSPRQRRTRRWAAIGVLPMSWITVTTSWMRRSLYATTDSRAMVVVRRRSLGTDVALITILAVGFVALFMLLQFGCVLLLRAGYPVAVALSQCIAFAYLLLALWLMIAAILMIWQGSASKSLAAVGPETPAGEHWVVESLAARTAADGAAVFRLAVRTVRSMPAGRVLVAVARTPELQAGYVKLGFTPGDHQRVYSVA
ncbi:hypothetical protein MUN77_15420 [Leucobacter allii]|uniref:hypothetical protein n=1 Tax=Leucobacter allii TaxID=2932247 RepID=UPI001FCFE441|nr:hypothetical protein [Leucobacter allii]UOR01497.1 hypothetical protein MUN77_15420 [Leucobacter allii]